MNIQVSVKAAGPAKPKPLPQSVLKRLKAHDAVVKETSKQSSEHLRDTERS